MKKLLLASTVSTITAIATIPLTAQANPLCEDEVLGMAWHAEIYIESYYDNTPIEFMMADPHSTPGLNQAMDEVLQDAYNQPWPKSRQEKQTIVEEFVEKWSRQCDAPSDIDYAALPMPATISYDNFIEYEDTDEYKRAAEEYAKSPNEVNILCEYGEMGNYATSALMSSQIGLPMSYAFEENEWAPGLNEDMKEMVQDAYNQPTNLRPNLQAQYNAAFVQKWEHYCEVQLFNALINSIQF